MRSWWLAAALLLGAASAVAPVANSEPPLAPVRELQQAADKAGPAASIVIVDVDSGRILAAHDPDLAAHRLAQPGSTLKPFVLLALLDTERLDAEARLVCRRPLLIGGKRMDCTHPAQVAALDAEEAIAYSCNSYVSQIVTYLAAGELVHLLRREGLDSRSDFASDESTGRIAQPSTLADLQLESLGDWGVEVTPLELLAAYRRLALRVRSGNIGKGGPVFKGLEGSVSYGMADNARVPGLRIAGKTGTAASPTSAETHGFFAGFAPADQPRIVVVSYVEHGNGADAAMLAQPIFAAFAKDAGR